MPVLPPLAGSGSGTLHPIAASKNSESGAVFLAWLDFRLRTARLVLLIMGFTVRQGSGWRAGEVLTPSPRPVCCNGGTIVTQIGRLPPNRPGTPRDAPRRPHQRDNPRYLSAIDEMTDAVDLASSFPAAVVTEEGSCFKAFQSEFDYLCRTLRRLGVRSEDIEDDAQDVFLVLRRKWPDYDPSRPLRPYLFGIAFRVVASRRRRQQRELPLTLETPQDESPGPEQVLEAEYARKLVLTALSHVPLARRAVLVMHDIDEVPMRDITKALSLPLFTGYSRLRKARREFEAAVKALRKGESLP
jgi:RNA polymerase sigma-70 factor (ECF subfamily)